MTQAFDRTGDRTSSRSAAHAAGEGVTARSSGRGTAQPIAGSAAAAGRGWLLFGLALGYFMVLLDTTVVSVALPAIRADLGGGIAGLQWVVNAYTIVFAGLLLSMGALADRFGAKRLYLLGLAAFLAASAASAAAPTLGALIGLRALLGAGGATLLPASLALIAQAYPDPASRARALGIWAAITGGAMAAGPVVGGVLVDTLGWHSIFLLNVPLSALSLVLTARFIGETPKRAGRGLDPVGQLSAILAIAALSFALMEGESLGWASAPIAGALAVALFAALVFIAAQAKGRSPMLPLGLFRIRTVSAGMLGGMIINAGLSGVLFVLPLFFQQVRGWSAHETGLALLPLTLPTAFNPIFTGRLVARVGARIPMTAGFALAAAGVWVQSAATNLTSYGVSLVALLLIGFGVSLTIPALVAAVMSAVPREQTGAASGALNASRQLGATLGVAVLGAILAGSGSLLAGVHTVLYACGAVLLGGSVLSLAAMGKR
ncbi:MFS transporter [Cohnella sp. REN36]|uniref:MFS transporter n=1 Tax=Cohnella sp. REN36 TaxID=2887347 RepID=UPI001D14BE0C|nr:MFS transporter [Cohnella sp. REN36]MCC3376748.1 MFS transporter [Cohnella sp. REN36]